MNIFHLSDNPRDCAQAHCDKHCVKMIVEHCQMLSTACHLFNLNTDGLYKKTHVNHPCAIWTRQSRQNFEYLLELTIELLEEYTFRYGKVHASSRLIPIFIDLIDKIPVGENKLTPFITAITGIESPIQDSNKTILLYRELYMTTKRDICTWKIRETPNWFK